MFIDIFAGFSACASQPKTEILAVVLVIGSIIATIIIFMQKFENVKYKLLLRFALLIAVIVVAIISYIVIGIPLTDFAPCG